MKKEFSSITELKSIREQIKMISKKEKDLSNPILSDRSIIPLIYEWFKEILNEMDPYPNVDSVIQRKKFLFIILYLFAPGALAGGRSPKGLRDKIANVFHDLSPCVISLNISDILFIYQNYKDFSGDIDHIYDEIMERLRSNNLCL